jgi:hypothetical protein
MLGLAYWALEVDMSPSSKQMEQELASIVEGLCL